MRFGTVRFSFCFGSRLSLGLLRRSMIIGLCRAVWSHISGVISSVMLGRLGLRICISMFAKLGYSSGMYGRISDPLVATGRFAFTRRAILRCMWFFWDIARVGSGCLVPHVFVEFCLPSIRIVSM